MVGKFFYPEFYVMQAQLETLLLETLLKQVFL